MRRALALVAAGIAVALIASSADAAQSAGADSGQSGDVADELARVLVVELDGRGLERERAGIVHVALNRSRIYGAPIAEVIRSLVERRSEWGAGCKSDPACSYNQKLERAHEHPEFDDARRFARAVLAGSPANPIGTRITFCHPAHPDLQRDRATGDAAARDLAADLRRRAAAETGATRAELYARANEVEGVDSRYAWNPDTRQYLPAWSVAPSVGGKAQHPPITIGSTRFA